MTKETLATEFKRLWYDEYLEWICRDANAYGEKLFIGRVDDGLAVWGTDILCDEEAGCCMLLQ